MWIARDKDGRLYLWKIKPIRAMERFNNCSEEFKQEELEIYNKVNPKEPFENGLQYWDFPNEVTPCEYIDAERYFEYSSKYKLEMDSTLFPELTWEDEPLEVNLVADPL